MYSVSEKPPRILQKREKSSLVEAEQKKGWVETEGWGFGFISPYKNSSPFLCPFFLSPPFFACPWLKIEWQSWRWIVGQLPFMQIMPFDGGEFLMCSGYNRRIKHRRPGLILLGEKLSSVITSSLHVVGRGVNSGRGFKKKLPSQSCSSWPPIELRGLQTIAWRSVIYHWYC